MPSKAPAPPLDIKEACVRAAHAFIAEHGVERLSLREVARRLGVSHQAPYKHFDSRDHLLAEVMRRCFRSFAAYLDERPAQAEARADLGALGRRYLRYAASHPVEYRLMFGTPWPAAAASAGLAADATHAFDVLRGVLQRVHGSSGVQQRTHDSAALQRRIDLDAMFIWSNMHGMASILQSDALAHLGLPARQRQQAAAHMFEMLGAALDAGASSPDPGAVA